MVIGVASLAAFLQVLGEACTQASNSLVTGRGEGWGCVPSSKGREKIGTMREDVLSVLPFSWPFVHLHRAGKAAYLD